MELRVMKLQATKRVRKEKHDLKAVKANRGYLRVELSFIIIVKIDSHLGK